MRLTQRPIPIETISFPTREARSRFVAHRFAPYFGQAVLDVGCFEAPLRALLSGVNYTGIDVAGNPDIEFDLDQGQPLPFEARRFPCVLCIDVLEHLDGLHQVFDEIWRVAADIIILSLPNCWRDARRPIERGKGAFGHYGLPNERPLDRHKWFFNLSEAEAFIRAHIAAHNGEIVEMFATEKPSPALPRMLRRLRYPGPRYANRYVNTLWAVLRVPPAAPDPTTAR